MKEQQWRNIKWNRNSNNRKAHKQENRFLTNEFLQENKFIVEQLRCEYPFIICLICRIIRIENHVQLNISPECFESKQLND